MSLASQINALATRIATEVKAKAAKVSPQFTGIANFNTDNTNNTYVDINAPAGKYAIIRFLTGGSGRWDFSRSDNSEPGGNVGSDFMVSRRADNGNWIDDPLLIKRSTGITTLIGLVTGAFQMSAGGGAGKVLTSDGSGVGSWQAPDVTQAELDAVAALIPALLAGTVTNGDATHAPTGDAVYDAIVAAIAGLSAVYQPLDSDLTAWAGKTAPTGTAVGTTDTQVITNKAIQPRVLSVSSSATPTYNTDNADVVEILSLAANITSMVTNKTGTPYHRQPLTFYFKDTGTARTITWGADFINGGVAALLTTTVVGKIHAVFFRYDSGLGKWVCMSCDPIGY